MTLRYMKKNLVKKGLEVFAEIDKNKNDYKNIKFGVREDSTNRAKI